MSEPTGWVLLTKQAPHRPGTGAGFNEGGTVTVERSAFTRSRFVGGCRLIVTAVRRVKETASPTSAARPFVLATEHDAAGWGWFVEPTPRDDPEFATTANWGEQTERKRESDEVFYFDVFDSSSNSLPVRVAAPEPS